MQGPSRLFFGLIHPWRYRHCDALNCKEPLTQQSGLTYQKTCILIWYVLIYCVALCLIWAADIFNCLLSCHNTRTAVLLKCMQSFCFLIHSVLLPGSVSIGDKPVLIYFTLRMKTVGSLQCRQTGTQQHVVSGWERVKQHTLPWKPEEFYIVQSHFKMTIYHIYWCLRYACV